MKVFTKISKFKASNKFTNIINKIKINNFGRLTNANKTLGNKSIFNYENAYRKIYF
jgi:hypothetical protein